MDKKYVSGVIREETRILDVNNLVTLVSDLKWEYFNKYHMEPKYIKLPVWVYVLLQHYSHQLIGFNEDKIKTYMGLIVCETYSISELNEIELF